ncbi:MAG: thioredoxin family protein [Robiginitalea sp.]|nr:thioredoxin family protein [Robiginitalea sp.]
MTNTRKLLPTLGIFLSLASSYAQGKSIQWMSFEALEDSLEVRPRKVLIDFYADWCAYCKKMDRVTFKDPEVVRKLNSEFYAVRMNVEAPDTVIFDGKRYTNPEFGKTRQPVHEIPRLLASREGVPFSLPAVLILDEGFRVQSRYFEYLSPKKMRRALQADKPE